MRRGDVPLRVVFHRRRSAIGRRVLVVARGRGSAAIRMGVDRPEAVGRFDGPPER